MVSSIHDRATGRWRSLLGSLNITVPGHPKKHGPCPVCAGKDRFRFDDKAGRGTWICNQCGAGTGVDLVMRVQGLDFIGACRVIDDLLPSTVVIAPARVRSVDPKVYTDQWRAAQPLSGNDPASWYLKARGICPERWPNQLRFAPRMSYRHEDGRKVQLPAMLALYVAPDMSGSTVHITYLDDAGHKADVPKPKQLAPCPVPAGGAVRLAMSADTMGVAEGIETALSAMLLHDVPVWATLNAGGLQKWVPPPTCRNVLIFGDHDSSFTGQTVAFGLAHRLRHEKEADRRTPRFGSVDVRIPGITIEREEVDTDWNDKTTGGGAWA